MSSHFVYECLDKRDRSLFPKNYCSSHTQNPGEDIKTLDCEISSLKASMIVICSNSVFERKPYLLERPTKISVCASWLTSWKTNSASHPPLAPAFGRRTSVEWVFRSGRTTLVWRMFYVEFVLLFRFGLCNPASNQQRCVHFRFANAPSNVRGRAQQARAASCF